MIDLLHTRLGRILEKNFFKTIISALIFMNPIALAPQVWTTISTSDVAGVSLTMWFIFAAIQIAVVFEGIRVRSSAMFWSMLISVIESLTIITVVIIRT